MKTNAAHGRLWFLLLVTGFLTLPENLWAASESGNWGIWLTVGRVFNLALVIGVLVWIARKPLSRFFAGRTQSIRTQLSEAQTARQEAEAKLAEMQSRMSRLDEELNELRQQAEREAQEEYQRLIAEAQRDAGKIIERARQEIQGFTRTAQMELKEHVAELSVQMAEERIRSEITDEDRGRLFARFISNLTTKK